MAKHLRSVLGLVISGGLLWWVLREVSPSEVISQLRQSNPWLFALSIICATLIFPLRARRWRTILDPVYPALPFSPLWQATAIGMGLNNLLPARAGEVARAFVLSKRTAVPFSASIGSLAIDRIFDSIILLMMGIGAILSPNFPAGFTIQGKSLQSFALVGAVIVGIVLAAIYSLIYFPGMLIRVFEFATGKFSDSFREKGKRTLLSFRDGLSVLRHPKHVVAIMLWTLAHWMLNTVAFWLAMWAVGIDAPFSAAVLLQTIIALGVAIPAAPGFFGVFEKAAIIGLSIYSVPVDLATTWAIGFHILSFLPITIIGAVYFSRLNLKLDDIRASSTA